MATNNNLTDFLTAVADAIRDKKGYSSSKTINPQNFPSEIASIGGTSVSYSTVTNWKTNVKAFCTTVANAIRAKESSSAKINPQNFPARIRAIEVYSMYITASKAITISVNGGNTSIPANTKTGLNPTTGFSTSYYSGPYITAIDCSKLNTSKFTTMGSMFYSCSKVTSLNVSSFDTSSVTDMSYMFYACDNLTSISGISNFNTSKVTTFYYMFRDCGSLSYLDLSSWDTTNITQYQYLFWNNSALSDIIFGPKWGKQTAELQLDLKRCGSNNYTLSRATFNSMLNMYNRASNGLSKMYIFVKNITNAPTNWTANMQARGYTITVG